MHAPVMPPPAAHKTLASSGRKLQAGFQLPRLWRPPEDTQVTEVDAAQSDVEATTEVSPEIAQEATTTSSVVESPPPPAEPKPVPREAAVQQVIQKLQEQRVRINSTADACGESSHAEGGIAPLPEGEVEAGTAINLTVGPHGDARTQCRLATLPTLMKVRCHASTVYVLFSALLE